MKKNDALNAAKTKGFIRLIAMGESGDGGYGSRIYLKKDGATEQWPTDRAEVSKVGREWAISFFPNGPFSVFDKEDLT